MAKFTLTMDSSQFAEYLQCPLRWYYRYHCNLISIDPEKKEALDKGTLVHRLLDIYYNYKAVNPKINSHEAASETIKFFKEAAAVEALGYDKELETFLCTRFVQYVNRWLNDDFNVPILNKIPGVEIGFSKILFEDEKNLFVVEGRIDLICRLADGDFMFVDHKSQDRQNFLYKYTPQFRTYAWATGYKYGMINYFRLQKTYMDNNTFYRDMISFPNGMIEGWHQKMLAICTEAAAGLNSESPEQFFINIRREHACAGSFSSHPCIYAHLCEEFDFNFKQQIKTFKYKIGEPWTPWKVEEEANVT